MRRRGEFDAAAGLGDVERDAQRGVRREQRVGRADEPQGPDVAGGIRSDIAVDRHVAPDFDHGGGVDGQPPAVRQHEVEADGGRAEDLGRRRHRPVDRHRVERGRHLRGGPVGREEPVGVGGPHPVQGRLSGGGGGDRQKRKSCGAAGEGHFRLRNPDYRERPAAAEESAAAISGPAAPTDTRTSDEPAACAGTVGRRSRGGRLIGG